MTGQEKYGRLTFLNKISREKALYLCDCGNEKEIYISNVRTGRTVSCGCRLKETHKPTHGMTNHPTYHTWENMLARCKKGTSQNKKYEKYYGSISVCEEWKIFENFYRDMGDKPEGMSIDRIDGSKGYSKENCRWATRKEQQRNIKSNVWIETELGRLCVSEFIKLCGISVGKFYSLKNEFGLHEAVRQSNEKRFQKR